MNRELLATLRSSVSENDSHAARMGKAKEALTRLFPLTAASFAALDDASVTVLDQFLYRFTKMQDSLGTRFLPALFSLLEDDDSPKAFLDILDRLEQLRVLESAETWQYFRELRNRIAHEYRETLEQTVQTLNLLYSEIHRFLNLYAIAREACLRRLA
ncbi:MAG: hypothetical protein WCQ50_15190 [Spirochaetota bacterium]